VTSAAPPAPKLNALSYFGYAAGDAANNLTFSMASLFLLLYYTDVVGLSAAAVGTLFLVVRAWDALADVVAGRIVDKTQTRWGKFRPFILFGSIPLLLLAVALFSVPDLSPRGRLAYAYISYALFGSAYSLVNIPYGSLAAAMTQLPDQRAKLATVRVLGTNLSILTLVFVVSPQIKGSSDLQRSLTLITLALVVVGFALYLFTFLTAREQVKRAAGTISLRDVAGMVRVNRPLLVLCLSSLVFLTGWFCLQTVGVYYARDVLGDATFFGPITLVQTVAGLVAALLVPYLVGTIGKKTAYIAFGTVAAAGGLGVALAPSSIPAVAISFFAVFGLGLGVVSTLMWALEADTVEYGEWKSGVRAEGAIYSVFSFTRKLGQAVGGAAAAYTIGFGGYVAAGEQQTSSAITAIKVAAGVIPSALILLAIAAMVAYPLSERRFREIAREIVSRRVPPSALHHRVGVSR
jgi:glucuronide carrier protein